MASLLFGLEIPSNDKPLAYLNDIGDDSDKLLRFYHYAEALVAFHRFYFGEKKDRGGFATSERVNPLKKQTVYLLGAGSTFTHRFQGCLLDVGIGMPHPVWRYAKAMFMGVMA